MAYIDIGGTLHSIASGNVVANTDELYDKHFEQKQNVINLNLSQAVLSCVKTITYDTETSTIQFKDGNGNLVYALSLASGGGNINDIVYNEGQLIIKYNSEERPNLVLDVFAKDAYYSKSEINDLQEHTWPINQVTLDNLLEENGLLIQD